MPVIFFCKTGKFIYKVTLRRFRVIISSVEKQYELHILNVCL
jgi:hypothetical protein